MRVFYESKRVRLSLTAFLALFAAAYGIRPGVADTRHASTECYEINKDTPFMDKPSLEKETWCYQSETGGTRFVYHVDSHGVVRPELSIAILPDGTLRHASLHGGKLTVHSMKLNRDWNPLGVALNPSELQNAKRIAEPVRVFAADGTEGLTKIMSLIGGRPRAEAEDLPFQAEIQEGNFKSKADYMPWKGFWYPQASGRLHNGASSPMAKYDRFVEKRIGVSPRAQSWEKRKHPPREFKWAGHCNGWSAASIMRPEPTQSITDPFSGTTFSVSDQKGLWMEVDYCPKNAFFGHRSFGNGSDGDIRAVDFHNVVTYYLGNLKKPVIMDLMSGSPVENRVVSGFEMTVKRMKGQIYRVSTKLTIHSYDNRPNDETGPAGVFYRTYSYLLEVDEQGHAISGKWQSRHPDFFWVPLAPEECKAKNPVVHEAWMNELYRISQRPLNAPMTPKIGMMPVEMVKEWKDTRKPGAAPLPDANATPPPADHRQPDGED